MIRNGDTFGQVWTTFLIDLREDSNTKHSGYLAIMISYHALSVHHSYTFTIHTQVQYSTVNITTFT